MQQHLNYPPEAKEKGLFGRLIVQFQVDSLGKAGDVEVLGAPHTVFIDEAIRVISSAPPWIPAMREGRNVKQMFVISIDFYPYKHEDDVIAEKPDPDQLDAKFRGEAAENFKDWIQQNLIYPPDALKIGIYGDLLVQYTITPEGKITDVTLLKGRHPLLDAEATRVVQSSPDWEPAKKAGQNIEQRNIITVSFKNPSGETSMEKKDVVDNEPAYVFVEVAASFGDGDINTFRNWVQQHLMYPPEAIEKGIHGRVTVQFVVDSYGKVGKVKVLHTPDPILNDETIRVINSSPKWIPAMLGGRFVTQLFVIPVTFEL